jgi:hypothetical protein
LLHGERSDRAKACLERRWPALPPSAGGDSKGQKSAKPKNGLGSGCQRLASRAPLQGRKDKSMLNLNRVTLIGCTGADAKTFANGPTTLSLATNVLDRRANQRMADTNRLAFAGGVEPSRQVGRNTPKGTPLFVESELIYDEYPKTVDAKSNSQTVQAQVTARVAKIRVQKLIRLDSAAAAQQKGKA